MLYITLHIRKEILTCVKDFNFYQYNFDAYFDKTGNMNCVAIAEIYELIEMIIKLKTILCEMNMLISIVNLMTDL